VKATIEIPDDLMREIKVKAAREDRKLRDLVPELLRKGLASERPSKRRHHVNFPLIKGTRTPSREEVSPERMAQILLDQDIESLVK
jgi:hypothetical protein